MHRSMFDSVAVELFLRFIDGNQDRPLKSKMDLEATKRLLLISQAYKVRQLEEDALERFDRLAELRGDTVAVIGFGLEQKDPKVVQVGLRNLRGKKIFVTEFNLDLEKEGCREYERKSLRLQESVMRGVENWATAAEHFTFD